MTETVAPAFVTPKRADHEPPTVSIVGTGRPLSEGIRLIHNEGRYGYILDKPIEGFDLAPMENTTTPRARGGASLRHRRFTEGTMFLPITLVSPDPAQMFDMLARLVSVVTNETNYFDVVFFDPYSQESRRRTVIYDSGLETMNEVSSTIHRLGVTATFLGIHWKGPEREVVERIAPPVKPLITAAPGSPVNRWDDPGFTDAAEYEPWFVVNGGLEKQGTGEFHGEYAHGQGIEVLPGETLSVAAQLSYVGGPHIGEISIWLRAYNAAEKYLIGSALKVISARYAGLHTGNFTVPTNGVSVRVGFYTGADVHSNTRVRIEKLAVRKEGGQLEGAYSFPFFPIFLADSTVQGGHELTVEGDAPVWPVWKITGPGRDVEIVGQGGGRLFVEGEVTSPITIITEPGKQTIYDDTGLIWERMKPGDDVFFSLVPGMNAVKMTMTGGTPESTIRATYSENWKTHRGTVAGALTDGGGMV